MSKFVKVYLSFITDKPSTSSQIMFQVFTPHALRVIWIFFIVPDTHPLLPGLRILHDKKLKKGASQRGAMGFKKEEGKNNENDALGLTRDPKKSLPRKLPEQGD